MNKIIGIIVEIAVIFLAIYFINRASDTTNINVGSTEENQEETREKGRVVFSVTDAAADMSTISKIELKVSNVAIFSETEGWVTVSTAPRIFDLLKLKSEDKSEILADINADAGTYSEIRLAVDSINVTTKSGTTSEAKLPSGELKIKTALTVNPDQTASVNLDFLADKSLIVTGNGKYIFAPVVKTEVKSNANVAVNALGEVSITGGKIDDTKTVGMDVDGSVKLDFEIPKNKKIDIGADDKIKIGL